MNTLKSGTQKKGAVAHALLTGPVCAIESAMDVKQSAKTPCKMLTGRRKASNVNMITSSTVPDKVVCAAVWGMSKAATARFVYRKNQGGSDYEAGL